MLLRPRTQVLVTQIVVAVAIALAVSTAATLTKEIFEDTRTGDILGNAIIIVGMPIVVWLCHRVGLQSTRLLDKNRVFADELFNDSKEIVLVQSRRTSSQGSARSQKVRWFDDKKED